MLGAASSSVHHRRCLTALVLCVALAGPVLAPRRALAAGGSWVGAALFLLEPLIPEPRLELNDELGDPSLVLGLPLGPSVAYSLDPAGLDLEGSLGVFCEPQVRFDGEHWRLLAGLDASAGFAALAGTGLHAEVGGLWGGDGSGGFVGVSLVPFSQPDSGLRLFTLTWRTLFTTEGTRHQVMLDLVSFRPGG